MEKPLTIETHRKAAGMSRAELAKAVGVTRQGIRLIEIGASVPTIKTARRIASALKSTVEDLWPETTDAG